MRTRSFLILGLAGLLGISSCSTASVEKPNTQSNSTAAANSNAVAVGNGTEVTPPRRADANNTTAADPLTPPDSATQDRIENLRKSGAAGPDIDPAELAMKNARPAPDNSTFASYLTDAGYEIRTFKNHPQLLKVEKKVTADGKQSLKVFLRDGKVIELPGQQINPLSTAPAAFILQMAGVQVKPEKAPAGPPATKKSGE